MTHTILFVDDERHIREFCKIELEDAGYRVLLAEDGEEAIDIAKTLTIDAIILDQHMVRCNGLEAAKHLRQLHPKLPVILCSADADFADKVSPWFDASILKSADLTELKSIVAQLLILTPQRNDDRTRRPTNHSATT